MQELRIKQYELCIAVPRFSFTMKNDFLNSIVERFPSIFKKTLVFTYEQGLFGELIQIKEIDEKWLFDFLNNCGKIKPKEYRYLSYEYKKKIMNFIIRTYAKGFLSEKKGNKTEIPFSSTIAFITSMTSENFESLKGYTWEQIEYITEGIIWNENEKTKKGQTRNRQNLKRRKNNKNETAEEALARIKREREKYNKQQENDR